MANSHGRLAGTRNSGALVLCLLLVISGGIAAAPQAGLGIFERQTDVGSPIRGGSAQYDAGRGLYTITGGGANMWANRDAFHFVWRRWSGDATLTASVELLGGDGEPHRKAGLMIRQGLGPSDAYADAVVHGVGLTALQYRENPGATTLEIRSPLSSPPFIRLERRGDTFTLFVAGADHNFRRVGSAVVKLRDPVYAGLVVCAHNPSALTAAVFRDVEFRH